MSNKKLAPKRPNELIDTLISFKFSFSRNEASLKADIIKNLSSRMLLNPRVILKPNWRDSPIG
jgi:hypothetical protein